MHDRSAPIRVESNRWHEAYEAEQLLGRRKSSHRRKLRRLGALALPRSARILDVACGTGEALRILHDEGFTHLSGADITVSDALKSASWAETIEADACELPYDDGLFDAVISMHSLHHLGGVVRVGKALEEWVRVLKPGGRLMVIDHYDSPQLRMAFWALSREWMPWPTPGLRSFRSQLREEKSYLYEYLDAWHAMPVLLQDLGCTVEVERHGLFFFYWTGRTRE